MCSHRSVEPVLKTYSPEFNLSVGHWGAIDGSNQWKDCDTAVIFGLPYLPDTWAANAYFALQGVKDNTWLQSKNRPHGKHKDVREALKTGHIVSSVVQAINRIRCRKVIDTDGNCPKADVYLMIPNGKEGKAILQGILQSMPKVNLKEWKFTGAKKKLRKGNYEGALVSYASAMHIGKVSASTITSALSIPKSTWDRLVERLKDSSTDLSQTLNGLGVRYTKERSGSRTLSYLIKN